MRDLARFFAHAIERQARGQHQAFLRAGDGDVNAPLVVTVIDRGERGDRVDHVERGMARGIDRLSDRTDAAGHAGGSFVVHDAHRLDLVLAVLFQLRLDRRRIDAAAPVGGNEIDREAEFGRHLVPQGSEVAGLEHQHAIAGGERIDERRFPGAGARGRIDHHGRLGLEHRLQPFEDFQTHLPELGAAMIDGGAVDRAQDPLGDIGRPGDLKEMASAAIRHGVLVRACGRAGSLSEKRPATTI